MYNLCKMTGLFRLTNVLWMPCDFVVQFILIEKEDIALVKELSLY